jgi:hypothetical protein
MGLEVCGVFGHARADVFCACAPARMRVACMHVYVCRNVWVYV